MQIVKLLNVCRGYGCGVDPLSVQTGVAVHFASGSIELNPRHVPRPGPVLLSSEINLLSHGANGEKPGSVLLPLEAIFLSQGVNGEGLISAAFFRGNLLVSRRQR